MREGVLGQLANNIGSGQSVHSQTLIRVSLGSWLSKVIGY